MALLRAVNVGGTGKLPMESLRAIGKDCGFDQVRTYIASGNLLFASGDEEIAIRQNLETRLAKSTRQSIDVFVRSIDELEAILAEDPFPDAPGNRHMVYFQHSAPADDFGDRCRDVNGERVWVRGREVHVDYCLGMRDSRLKFADKAPRTARNMNTVRKLAQLLVR